MLVDIVIPVVNKNDGIHHCLHSLQKLRPIIKSVIIINQTGKKIKSANILNVLEVKTNKISASEARNKGAKYSCAEYLMFIDDDAFILNAGIKNLKTFLKTNIYDVLLLKRADKYSKAREKLSIRNFPNYVIEWNLIIRRSLFEEFKGFPSFGVGSKSRAQSGESFLLIGRMISSKKAQIKIVRDTEVSHPTLSLVLTEAKAKGYLYGNGHAIGLLSRELKFIDKLYWLFRVHLAFIKRTIFASKYLLLLNFRAFLMPLQTLVGFWYALFIIEDKS